MNKIIKTFSGFVHFACGVCPECHSNEPAIMYCKVCNHNTVPRYKQLFKFIGVPKINKPLNKQQNTAPEAALATS